MAKQAQGLSPNFLSIISSNIPESHFFRWMFIPERRNEKQVEAVIRIFKKGVSAPLMMFTVGNEQEISVEEILPLFVEEEEYEWEVEINTSTRTTSLSDRASFRFASVAIHEDLKWPDGPIPYEYIGSRKYFEEIRENAISIFGDYTLDNDSEIDTLIELSMIFTGNVVPSRKDFICLENALRIIATKEYASRQDIYRLIEDGLGASDIHKVYEILTNLANIPPYQPINFSVVVEQPKMYEITKATTKNKDILDTTIQTEWEIGNVPETKSYISCWYELNEDISYYKLDVITGFDDLVITHPLIYRVEDLKRLGDKIYFNLNQSEYENRSKSHKGICGFSVVAVDKRKQESTNYSIVQPVENLYLGVSHYVLQNEIYALSGAAAIKPYSDLYVGPNNRFTHYVEGDASGFYHYAVKAVDKSGLESDWLYFGPIKIDTFKDPGPSIPPSKPDPEDPFTPPVVEPPPIEPSIPPSTIAPLEIPKPIVTEVTATSATISWKAVKNADSYEIKLIESQKSTSISHQFTGLDEATSYMVMIRSINKEATSDWASVHFVTASKPVLKKEASPLLTKCWRSSHHIKYQNGNQVHPKGGWRNDINGEVIQGEWIELRNQSQDGLAIQAGTRWGNHKSIVIFDYADWTETLQDKEIILVELYIKRMSPTHGYANDGRFLNIYTHNYDEIPNEEPILSNRHEIRDKIWDRGQGHWVTLPTKFGELLKIGEAKGIALHHPNVYVNPPANYSFCRFDANSIRLRIHYK